MDAKFDADRRCVGERVAVRYVRVIGPRTPIPGRLKLVPLSLGLGRAARRRLVR